MTLSFLFARESDLIYRAQSTADIYITVEQSKLDWIYVNPDSDSLHLSSLRFQNNLLDINIDSVGFSIRGNTSRNSAKKSFKLDLNEYVKGQKIVGIEKLNLKAEQNDPSLIRSTFAFKLMEKIGLKASRVTYARVYINDNYMGLYEIIEHIDENFANYHFGNNDGNLWKCLWPADLNYRGSDPSNYHPYSNDTRPYELKTNVEEYDYSELAHFIDVINNSPPSVKKDSLESVLVVTDFIKYLAVNIMTGSWDDYRYLKNNYYLYHDPRIDKFRFIPYDYDNTFGIDWVEGGSWGDPNWARINMYTYAVSDNSGRPLSDLIFNTPEYRDLFTHFVEFYTNHVFREDQWRTYGDSIKAAIRPDLANDSYYPRDHGFNMNIFDDSYDTDFRRAHVERGLYEFMRKRRESTNRDISWENAPTSIYRRDISQIGKKLYVDISAFSALGIKNIDLEIFDASNNKNSSVSLKRDKLQGTSMVELYDRWTLSTDIADNDKYYRIVAVDSNMQTSSWPRHGYLEFEEQSIYAGTLFINEIMASNNVTIADPAGDYDDWLEIYNASNNSIDLSGMCLTDKENELARWTFPQGTNIHAGDYLLVWCDKDHDIDQEGLHTNFKLSAAGEFLALVDKDLSIIDKLYFPPIATDVSYGRQEDGHHKWVYFEKPTPGASNGGTSITEQLPLTTKLHANYPNPFNPMTSIPFELAADAQVELAIYNLNGQKVQTLVQSYQSQGSYQYTWNAHALPSGIYMAVLKIDAKIADTKKMILLK